MNAGGRFQCGAVQRGRTRIGRRGRGTGVARLMIHRIEQIVQQLQSTMDLDFHPTRRFFDRLSTMSNGNDFQFDPSTILTEDNPVPSL